MYSPDYNVDYSHMEVERSGVEKIPKLGSLGFAMIGRWGEQDYHCKISLSF